MTFQEKLERILSEDKKSVLKESEEAYGTHSPTQVKPEKGQEVTSSLDGTGKIDATGPIPTGAEATLKTTPGVSASEGPTGHIPQNSDLPRKQLDGLGTDNKAAGKNSLPPTPKVYGLHEEEDDEKKEVKEEKKELPPFMKKKEVKEETDAAKTLKSPPSGAGEKAEKLQVKEETDQEEGDKTKSSIKEEEKEPDDDKDDKKAVKEATAALFAGEMISEVLREKTSVIFEATLSARIKDIREKLTQRFTKQLNERVEKIREDLTEAVSGHLDLVVEHWVKENEVPLERAIKSELVEEFISGLKTLFEENYIELPQEKVDVVSEMVTRITKLETRLNEQIETNVQLKNAVKLHERSDVFEKVTKGMVSTKAEKLRNLSESVEYKNAKQFETALTTLKESVDNSTQKTAPAKQTLSEQTLEQSPDPVASNMMSSLKATAARMKENR
jgi:hypothetical protein